MSSPYPTTAQLVTNDIRRAVPNTEGLRVSVVQEMTDHGYATYTGVGVDRDGDVFIHRVGSEETIYLLPDAAFALANLLETYASVARAFEDESEVPKLT